MPGGDAVEPIVAAGRRLREVGRVDHQDPAALVVVDLAEALDEAALVEDQLGRLLVLAIAPEIEALRLRVREDAMVFVVEIRERDLAAALDREQARGELIVMLSHLRARRRGALCGARRFDEDHGRRRVGRADRGARLRLVAWIRKRRRRALGKRHSPLDRGALACR
jgi:hypothetical protein